MAPFNITGINMTNISLSHLADLTPSEYIASIKPLVFFIIGMVVYALFVFKFYRFLARKDILELKTKKYYEGFEGFLEHFFKSIFYFLENLVLIPLLVFFWFGVLATLILFLTKSNTPDLVLLSAMAIVGAVRVTSYYDEDLSKDLAKMIPFALLGVFIVDMSYFSIESSISMAKQLPLFFDKMILYLLFVVIIEFVMRLLFAVVKRFKKKTTSSE